MFAPPSVANAKAGQAISIQRESSSLSTSNMDDVGSAGALLPSRERDLTGSASAPNLEHSDQNDQLNDELPNSLTASLETQSPKDSDSSLNKDLQSRRDNENEGRPTGSNASTISLDATTKTQRTSSSPSALSTIDPFKKKSKKNRRNAWLNLISPSYKSKCEDFRKLFKDVPESEMLVVDYSCAFQREMLVHGRLYVTQNHLCFYANIFKWETTVVLKCKDITSMTKEKTALVIPNAIQCSTENGEKFFFTSFAARDKAYLMLFRIWQNALLSQPMSNSECWKWVHYSYGDELGLSSDDEDFYPPDALTSAGKKFDSELAVEEGELAQPESIRGSPNHRQTAQGLLEDSQRSTSSDEADDDENATKCSRCDYEHASSTLFLDERFNMSVDHVFTCLFTVSEFYENFMRNTRKTTGLTTKNWTKISGEYKQQREVDYWLPLNMQLAKSCTVKETQRLHRNSRAGRGYYILNECVNGAIPYADTFYVETHFCLTAEGNDRCRLQYFNKIIFKKAPWGFMKSMMEKSAMQGAKLFGSDLNEALSEEEKRYINSSGSPLVKAEPRAVIALPPAEQNPGAFAESSLLPLPRLTSVLIFVCVFLLLCVFYLLWLLNSVPSDLGTDINIPGELPTTNEAWEKLFRERELQNRRQLESLQKLVERTLTGLDNMKVAYKSILQVISQRTGAHIVRDKEL